MLFKRCLKRLKLPLPGSAIGTPNAYCEKNRITGIVAALDNDGGVKTFRKGKSDPFVDLTFASCALMRGIIWRVSAGYTDSIHQIIFFKLQKSCRARYQHL